MEDPSTFIQLALINNDEFGLLLAAECKRKKKVKKRIVFNFNSFEAPRYKLDFRFEKPDIFRLFHAFEIPDEIEVSSGHKYSGFESLCVLLRRLSYPNRLSDLSPMFGKSKQDLSKMFNFMIEYLYLNFGERLTSLDQRWLMGDRLTLLCSAIREKGCPMPSCFGFIDGTLHKICRPQKYQREVYSGHKRTHGLKYQSIVTPNGLIANLYGPVPGRRHDSFMLNQSQIIAKMNEFLGAQQPRRQLYVYGDSGYPLSPFIITPHGGNNLTEEQQSFNTRMSKLRVCVEWEFGELDRQFAFIDFKKNLKLFLQPVYKIYAVAVLLKNCQACLYGCNTSDYFNCMPPTLEQYLKNED